MSFSSEVKKELLEIVPSARHCLLAELSALLMILRPGEEEERRGVLARTESEGTASLLFTLFRKAYNIVPVVTQTESRKRGRGVSYEIACGGGITPEEVKKSLGHSSLLRLACCVRSFLRGAFLAAGSVSDPEKSYHLEIVCEERGTSEAVQSAMRSLMLDAKIVLRKDDHVVYLKEGDQIVTLLGEMGASISFLNIESVRVMKEMRGSVNRIVNCETANLNKTVVSAVRQMDDIRYIRDHGGFGDLPDALREMAEVRLAHPDAPLAELGQYLDPPIGKSGVNHRLRKLGGIAEKMRAH